SSAAAGIFVGGDIVFATANGGEATADWRSANPAQYGHRNWAGRVVPAHAPACGSAGSCFHAGCSGPCRSPFGARFSCHGIQDPFANGPGLFGPAWHPVGGLGLRGAWTGADLSSSRVWEQVVMRRKVSHQSTAVLGLNLRSCAYLDGADATLRDMQLDVHPGSLTVISGPSCSGKSTLGAVLAGLLPRQGMDQLVGTVKV